MGKMLTQGKKVHTPLRKWALQPKKCILGVENGHFDGEKCSLKVKKSILHSENGHYNQKSAYSAWKMDTMMGKMHTQAKKVRAPLKKCILKWGNLILSVENRPVN